MNCNRLEAVITEMARDATTEVEEQAIAHLRSCPQCAAALADQRSLTSGLKALAWNTRSVAAPAHVEAELRAAFRRTAAASGPTDSKAGRARLRFRLAFAAAAVLLIVLAASYYRQQSSTNTSSAASESRAAAPEASRQDAAPSPPLVAQGGDGQADGTASTPAPSSPGDGSRHWKASHRAPHQRENVARFESSEAGMDFVPLIYGSDLTPLEGGQILRVRLPRSALASLGFPVNMERPDETLMADVMLGEDGLARSIRLVNSSERSPKD